MVDVFRSYQRFEGVRGNFGALPAWARFIVTLAALPGILALALSVLLVCASLLALLLLTVPVYIALRGLIGWSSGGAIGPTVVVAQTSGVPVDVIDSHGQPVACEPSVRRHVEVKILSEE